MRRKTPKMLAFEERIGRPVEVALVEAINRHGSTTAAAVALGLPYDTVMRWLAALRIDYRVTAVASMPEAAASG